MRVDLKKKRFYISLPSRLYNDLIEFNKLHETMDFDLAVLILHFIIKQQSEPQEWAPLSSKILRKYDHGKYKSNLHTKLLKEGGFVERLPHKNNIPGKKNSCRKYRISLRYFEQSKIPKSDNIAFISHDLRQQPLLKKIEKHKNWKRKEADARTPHLTKWLNSEDFTIEEKAAIEYVEKQYSIDSFKHLIRLEKIKNFDPSQAYSRNGKDDRLHSIFTQLPSDLKKFVRFKGQQLIEVDIKSSQPLMFAILLEKILAHYNELSKGGYRVTRVRLKNRIFKSLNEWINNDDINYHNNNKYTIDIEQISNSITIILLESLKHPDFTEIYSFISLVKSGFIYEHLGELMLSMEVIWEKEKVYYARIFNKMENIQVDTPFESLRACAKKLMINALYSPRGKGSVTVINKVKDLFHPVFLIADALKVNNYEDFPLILQRMEAKCVLDHCAKNIANKYPDMPLIARHDSLSTTEHFGDSLWDEFQKQINCYFGTTIRLEKDIW